MLGCDVLGVWDGGGVVCAAPAAGDGGGAAVWPLLEIEIIRRHDDSSATANHAFFEFIKSHPPVPDFVVLRDCTARWDSEGIRWTTYPAVVNPVQRFFTEKKKLLVAGWIM